MAKTKETEVPTPDSPIPDSPTPTPTRWRGVPVSERKAERRRLLVDAAFDLLGTEGVAGTSVRGVCEATQLNPRYFYESFADLDELLVAVYDRTSEEAFAVMVAAIEAHAGSGHQERAEPERSGDQNELAEPDPRAVTRAGVGAFVRHVTSDPRRARVIFIEGLGNEALSRRRMESMHALAHGMEQDALDKLGTDKVGPTVTVAINLIVGGMAELMIAWLLGHLDLSLDELVDNASELFVAVSEAAQAIEALQR